MLGIYAKFHDLCDRAKRGKTGGGSKVFHEGYSMSLPYLEVRVTAKEGKDWDLIKVDQCDKYIYIYPAM